MTFVVSKNTFSSFESWRSTIMVERERANPVVSCPACKGSGYIYEECDCCGHESESGCGTCDKTGKVHFCHLNSDQQWATVTFEDYEKELIETAVLLGRSVNRDPFSILVDVGWNPAQRFDRIGKEYRPGRVQLDDRHLAPIIIRQTSRKAAA